MYDTLPLNMSSPDSPRAEILFLQHDHLEFEDDVDTLSAIKGLTLTRVATASNLMDELEKIREVPPRAIVGRVNLPVRYPSPELPTEVPRFIYEGCLEDPNTVGLRCLDMLSRRSETSMTPLVLATTFEPAELSILYSHVGVSKPEELVYVNRFSKYFQNRFRDLIRSYLP
jgi:hypothetical protein